MAQLGDTEPPVDPEDEVDYHYVTFVRSHRNGLLYMMDGDRNGPVELGSLQSDDVLSLQGLDMVREFVRLHGEDGNFSLLALTESTAAQVNIGNNAAQPTSNN